MHGSSYHVSQTRQGVEDESDEGKEAFRPHVEAVFAYERCKLKVACNVDGSKSRRRNEDHSPILRIK